MTSYLADFVNIWERGLSLRRPLLALQWTLYSLVYMAKFGKWF